MLYFSPQDIQLLSKVEASLEINQVVLRPEAKNFTEVATLACRGDHSFQLKYLLLIYHHILSG